jgi:UDP-3-O-[3-hydroxymyristoyl] glucosamine N-acyltransferase
VQHPGFFRKAGPFGLQEVADAAGAVLASGADASLQVSGIAALDEASSSEISFFDNIRYREKFKHTTAAACLVAEKFSHHAPEATIPLLSPDPYRSFALALQMFYPEAMRPLTTHTGGEAIHPSAKIEEGVNIEAGAVVGPEAMIGSGSTISAGAAVGCRVAVGRNCYLGPNTSVIHTLIGNNVIIHSGACIGQDGFGFAMGPQGHIKVPQIGRVIIQDDVEIGSNTMIDRGALRDTVIGEGTKIDNMVQIGHNVVIGRHCVIVAQVGISGSTELGDFVVMGGDSGVIGHMKIGDGAQIAGSSKVSKNVPAGEKWGGTPAKPIKAWFREIAALKRLGEKRPADGNDS